MSLLGIYSVFGPILLFMISLTCAALTLTSIWVSWRQSITVRMTLVLSLSPSTFSLISFCLTLNSMRLLNTKAWRNSRHASLVFHEFSELRVVSISWKMRLDDTQLSDNDI